MVVPPVAHVTAGLQQPGNLPEGEWLFIGCGNPTRQDDGVGPWVARELAQFVAKKGLSGVRVVDAGTAGMEVMFTARGAARLFIIDACRGAGPPGAVFRMPGHEVASEAPATMSLHDFRWNHALYGGRKMYGEAFPSRVEIFLVEAEALDFGLELSDAALSGARKVLRQLEDELEHCH